MLLALLLAMAPPVQAQDCSQTGRRSLMDILNDLQSAAETQEEEDTAEEESTPVVEPETTEEPNPTQHDSVGAYVSSEQEYAPVQIAASGLPPGASSLSWQRPSSYTFYVDFSGAAGSKAVHEGMDYVHNDSSQPEVPVQAAAAGEVVYVRLGCPQSSLFGKNGSARECGSGWGNHVVVHHGNGVYIRYAHLDPGSVTVRVGDSVQQGATMAMMGNSGRSETRHLHWELGTSASGFDPNARAQSFDAVYNPALLPMR